jgi:GTPase SAR1 family protein
MHIWRCPELRKSVKVSFHHWNTAGQEQYQALTAIDLKSPQIGLTCDSVLEQRSFVALIKCVDKIRESSQQATIIMINTQEDRIEGEEGEVCDVLSARLVLTIANTGSWKRLKMSTGLGSTATGCSIRWMDSERMTIQNADADTKTIRRSFARTGRSLLMK